METQLLRSGFFIFDSVNIIRSGFISVQRHNTTALSFIQKMCQSCHFKKPGDCQMPAGKHLSLSDHDFQTGHFNLHTPTGHTYRDIILQTGQRSTERLSNLRRAAQLGSGRQDVTHSSGS